MIKNIQKGLFVAVLIIILNACNKPMSPEFKSVENLEVKTKTSTNITITADALFYNPNNYKIILKEADIDVLFNNKLITTYQKKYDLKINKNEEFTVPLEVNLSLKDLDQNMISSAINIFLGKKPVISYKGNIKVKAYGVRIRVPVDGESKININF